MCERECERESVRERESKIKREGDKEEKDRYIVEMKDMRRK